ncbi:MAG: histidinol-phosphatase HisJ family protein, partial [Erysipelotrichaceae bacterium]|nr:histidinol-phosphatase HisJ family protein [Erysipelotrichaceae bacterium]
MLVDYHVHSEFSDDSRESMEKQIEKAIELGFDEICFTDHVDYGIKKDWAEGNIEWRGGDGISSSADKLDPLSNVNYMEYFGKILRMKETYKGKIQIKSGLEFGVQSITIPQYEELWARWNNVLDFALLSMHQVNNQEFWTQEFQQGKTQKQYNEEYYEEILKVIRQYKHYSVLAHLDLIVRYDKQGVYPFDKVKDLIAEILRTAIADGKGIEINTSSWHYGLKNTQPSRDI